MSNDAFKSEDIGIVLNGLVAVGEAERLAQYRLWAETPACEAAVVAIKAGKLEDFHLQLLYPFKKMVDGLLQDTLPGLHRAHFLLAHYDFVRAHFRRMIEVHDGFGCCADKTRAILARLLCFYISGHAIEFDALSSYTFHHPKNVFTTHEATVEFFDSLYHLHSGDPSLYLVAIKNIIINQAEVSKEKDEK